MPAVCRMMQFVQYHEGGPFGASSLEHLRCEGHLLIGDNRAMIVRRLTCLLVCQSGIQVQADRSRRIGPLGSQVIRGAHD
jgi:hypothetical protein